VRAQELLEGLAVMAGALVALAGCLVLILGRLP